MTRNSILSPAEIKSCLASIASVPADRCEELHQIWKQTKSLKSLMDWSQAVADSSAQLARDIAAFRLSVNLN